jgi:hypothetical protein
MVGNPEVGKLRPGPLRIRAAGDSPALSVGAGSNYSI